MYSATDTSSLQSPLVFETFYSPVSMGRGMTGLTARNSLADAIQNPATLRQSKYFNITYVAQRNHEEMPVLDDISGVKSMRHHYNFFAGIGVKPHKFVDVGIAYLVPYSGQFRAEDVTMYDLEGEDLVEVGEGSLYSSERLEQIAVPIKLNLNEFFAVGLTLSYFKYTAKLNLDHDNLYTVHSQFWHPTFGFLWDVSPRVLIGGRYKPRVRANMSDSVGSELRELIMVEERALGVQFVMNYRMRLYAEGEFKRYTQFNTGGHDNVMDYHIGCDYSPSRMLTLRLGHFTRNNFYIDTSSALTNHQSYLTAGFSLHVGERIDINVGYIDGDYLDVADNKKAHVSAGVEIKI